MFSQLFSPIKLLGLWIWAFVFCFFWIGCAQYVGQEYCDTGDLMQQAFCVANRKDTIIDVWHTANAVGNEVIKGSTKISIGWSKFFDVSKNESIIMRITKFILMLTIVLSVTMIILNGIQYIIKSWNGEDPSKSRTNLIYIVVGIILALFSVVIVNLLRSVGESTLKEISLSNPIVQNTLS